MYPSIEFMRLVYRNHRLYNLQVYAKHRKWRPLWKFLDALLRAITFGKMKGLYTDYTTVIGPWVFFPAGWSSETATLRDCVTLQHEVEHIRWYRAAGLSSVWLGFLVVGLLYLLFPLPVGLAWFRYVMERAAYKVTIEACRRYHIDVDPQHYAVALSGPAYFWCWPRKWVSKWFARFELPEL